VALAAGGRKARETDPRLGAGSTDMGDVSHVVPAIHPYLAIVGEGEALCHEHRFAAAAASDQAAQTALAAAKAMAKTAIELLGSPALRQAVRAEWSEHR
jgi:metal-dependent amidase/aminoacylase/carboxypeptidase family protein